MPNDVKKYRLLRELPGIGVGSIFIKTYSGYSYETKTFNLMLPYIFVENSPDWFQEVTGEKERLEYWHNKQLEVIESMQRTLFTMLTEMASCYKNK